MKKVLIPTKLNAAAKSMLEEHGYTVVQDADTSMEELIKQNADTEAMIVRSDKVTAEVLDALPSLKLVVRAGAGYNTIDIKHARKNDVDVMNTPGANSNAVAEEVIALVLGYFRHIVVGDRTTREGKWEKKKLMGRELTGKTVGVVGLGNIGRLVIERLAGFECRIIGYDPLINAARAEEMGVELMAMEDVFSQADVITLHIPENDETKGIVNRRLFDRMKDNAVLVNCARAGIINEDDLREARKTKSIGFLNDVYPADKEGEKSVADIADIMLPHLGASTEEANLNAATRAAEQLIAYDRRGVTKFVVNEAVPEGLDAIYQELAFQMGYIARHYLGSTTSVTRLECCFYGELGQFDRWLLPPVVAGISPEVESGTDFDEAEAFLKEMGVSYEIRDVTAEKRYGESIALHLFEGDETIRRVVLRGTVAEGVPVISRINDFDRLYIEPRGHSLFAIYPDRPGIMAKIAAALADADINIEDMRCPHNQTRDRSVAMLKTNVPVPAEVVDRIRKDIDPEVVFAVSMA